MLKYLYLIVFTVFLQLCLVDQAELSCREQNYASHEFLSSPGGYSIDSLTQDICKDQCAEYKFEYSGLMAGLFCLCGNDASDFNDVDSSKCDAACPGDLNQICGSNDTDLIYIIPASKIGTIDGIAIDLPSEVAFRNEEVQINVTVQSSATFEVFVNYGDGFSYKVKNSGDLRLKKTYFVPGEYTVWASVTDLSNVQPALFAEATVAVEDKDVSFSLDCPEVIEPGVLLQCQVFLMSGWSVSMTYKMSQEDEYITIDLADTMYVKYGNLEPFNYNKDETIDTGAEVVYSPFTKSEFSSFLIGFMYYVVKEGTFEFLILRPKCDSGSYCPQVSDCSSSCSEQNILQCGSSATLCSLTGRCTDPEEPFFCRSNNSLTYKIVQSFKTENVKSGMNFFNDFPPGSQQVILPGDIFGFRTDGSSSIFSRYASSDEIQNGYQDTSDEGGLGVLHLYKPIAIDTSNVTIEYIYNKSGKYEVTVELSNPWLDEPSTKKETLFVEVPLSGIEITMMHKSVLVKKEESVCIYGNGSNINVHWDYEDGSNETFYDDVLPESGLCFDVTCQSDGTKFLNVTLKNHWNETSVTDTFHCFHAIGKDWKLSSDSPKSTPPGEISFELKFEGSYSLSSFEYTVNFGDDDSTQNAIKIEKVEDPITFSHSYESEGNFTVFVNLSNPVDFEVLKLQVQIFEKMGNLSVTPYFVKSGSYPENKTELKGKKNTDAPLGSTVYFENSISGHVSRYMIEFEDGSYSKEFEDPVFSYSFSELGNWIINFTAWNAEVEEYSNIVQLEVKILTDISDVEFSSSTSETTVDEDIEFLIELTDFDSYSCVIFNGGDYSRLLAFGNKETCTLNYDENKFKFIKKTSDNSRKRRAASKAEWKDDSTIRILYSYMFGGDFSPSVDVFNSVSQDKKNLSIAVTDKDYLAPLVWIDKNSTDISSPIECQRGYDCRYETTAIFRNNESYLASHQWTAFAIDSDGKEEEIDISHLKTNNCSALRVTKRSLELGLYKLKYTLTVYYEEHDEESDREYDEESDEEYVDYYYAAAKQNEEEEVYDNLYDNLTIISRRSVSSYLKIIPTPLIPMLINGGASYLVRGFGQKISLEPTIYTEDPDYPDEKNFDVTWYCLCSDKNESITKKGDYEYDDGNPSKPIDDQSTLTDDKGGCFGKGPGLMEIETADYDLKSDSFRAWDTLYELIAVIRKDGKVTEGRLFVKIIEDRPPSLKVMCEKRIACFPDVKGLYINPNLWVPLTVECIEDCGEGDLKLEWNLYASDLKTREKIPIENWQKHATVDFNRMGLNQSLYEENPDVNVFLVEVVGYLSDPNIPRGESYLFLIINRPPKEGKCSISQSSGMALLDIFTVEISGWEDEDGHEIQDYSIYVTYGNESLRLLYGMKSEVRIVLPYGDLQIWCSAADYLGAKTMYSIANFSTILPTEEELEAYEQKRFFEKCLAEGRMSLASQVIIAKNSIIMEYRRRENKSGNFDDVSDRAIDNRWHEYWELDGIDSSYYTVQARDEIREELREVMEKQMDRDAKKKNKEIGRLLRLPMEALADAEIFGGALSAVADTGPTDMSGKLKIMRGMENIFDVINDTDVPHPEEKKIVFSQFGSLADTVAGSLAESNIGGHFLPAEMKKAEQELDYNATEPNYFIFYVEGNRTEVQQNLKTRAVEAAKEDQLVNAKEMVLQIKDMISSIQQNCMEEIMVGPNPFYTESKNGFQMTFFKNYASNLSGISIQQGPSSVILPDLCKILDDEDCKNDNLAVGVQAVRWTQPLESYAAESSKLNEGSNVIQIDITPREGNSTIPVNNTKDPFIICIPVKEGESRMEYIVPSFSRDDDILVYHTLFIESPGISATVNIKPDNSGAPLVVFYQYGELPSLMDYDGIQRLQDINAENGVFRLFIGPDVITEEGKNLSIGIGHAANNTDLDLFFSNPERFNLSVINMTNQFSTNYAIEITTTGCYYFSDEEEKWSSGGCKVVESKSGVTCCSCNHLTSFGSGLFITPNEINFSYVFANADIAQNITIYVTIITAFSLFIILLIFARWKDRKDLQKLGASPLPDNESADKYVYEILVYTGHQRNAGTKSNVFFIASGEDDETEVRNLADNKRPILRKGSIDIFVMSVPRSLGQLNYLRIWHDNSGPGKWSSWFCQYIIFRDVQTGHKFEFLINKWFGVEYEDGMIDRLVPVSGREQVSEFSHLFSTHSRRNLADNHLWFSVFLRPPRSRFTRVQRVSCCMAVLCLSMLANAMYYQRTSAKPQSGGFKFGPFALSPEEIAVGIISNILIFPPTFVMIFFFRKSRPRKLRPSRIEEALKQQRLEWKQKNPEPPAVTVHRHPRKSDAEAGLQRPRKKKFTLPWWCVGFGWLLVVASIATSLFFLWAYGIEFGDEKTSKWLKSLVIAFFSSVLITQPIKIICMAIVVSCMCRSMDYDNDDADEDEEDPHLNSDEEYLHNYGKRSERHLRYEPMDLDALEEARKEREKEVKMFAVIREISAYFFFLWVIMILSYGNRDPSNFYLREALINGFVKPGDQWVDFNNVNTEKRFWNWTYNALVPELFAMPWYNGRSPLGLRLYLDDRNNLKIGYAVLRQVRIQPRSCDVSWLIESVTPECAGFGGMVFEDGTLYTKGWRTVNSSETLVPPEYKYLTASQLRGYPFWGQMDWYGGGGYVVPLVTRRDSGVRRLLRRLEALERDGWVDRHTRAVFIEFGVYNAQINLFCAATIVAEFLPGGGVVPYYHMDPLRLLNYHTGAGWFQLTVELLFVGFTLFFTVRELRSLCRQGPREYLSQYWNVAELTSIVVSYTGIANHVYKLFATAEILRIFTETEGTGYVKLQEAVLLNELFCYQIGLVMSISTLKFLKLLRFNKRIGVLSSTLKACATELRSYSVCLLVVFGAFVALFWLLLGRQVREFCTFAYSFESSISMMLKKFDYEAMRAAQPVLAPAAFFTFSLATAVVLINILLSIIIRSFEDVKHDASKQSNEYEILDFFIQRMRMVMGCSSRVRPLPVHRRQGDKEKKDSVAAFPDKVDRLVDFINDFYFENQMDFKADFLRKMGDDLAAQRKAKPTLAPAKSKIPKSVAERFDDF